MATVGTSSGLGGVLGSTFTSSSRTSSTQPSTTASSAVGVAALDTPQLSQTKTEIRTLIAEIAELSSAEINRDEFLRGMLSRVCMAMGATAAAMWTIADDHSLECTSSYNFPAALDESNVAANDAHRRVLSCIAAEGQPILVPPGSVRIDAQRPTNPIDEALLVVPIRIHNRVDALLEVIQSGSGGPAAQRGYLRFVAQMADLLADYLRRDKLRELANDAEYVQQLQHHILAICSARSPSERSRAAATAVSRLLGADLVLLLCKRGRKWRVQAISELQAFDPRSETVAAAQRLMSEIEKRQGLAGEKVEVLAEVPATATDSTTASPTASTARSAAVTTAVAQRADALRELLTCDRLARLPLMQSCDWQFLLALDHSIELTKLSIKARELLPAIGSLVTPTGTTQFWPAWLPNILQTHLAGSQLAGAQVAPARASRWARAERWIVRASTIGLIAALALFPTPDQIAVVAVLEADQKQMYYAPSAATIEQVLVDSGQSVKAGEVLLELSDKQLEAQLNEVAGQRLTADTQLAQDTALLKRGQQLPQQQDELESRAVQSKIAIAALDEKLAILRTQAFQLKVVARSDAVITTWDARNRLEGRPVAAGQLLLATCSPESDWRLQLSISQQKAGMVEDALARAAHGLQVHFSLSSHPSEVRTGRLVKLSEQLVNDDDGSAKVIGTVIVDARTLPAKTDGAVARAAIDCGRVTATWFVLRDVYREASAWIRMTW